MEKENELAQYDRSSQKEELQNFYTGLVCIEEGEVDVSSREEQFTVYWIPNVLRTPYINC